MAQTKIEKIKEDLTKTVVKDRPISKELETSFLEYAMSVIVARALPDARDGFKPVHRRVLYAAYNLGMTSDRPHKKSARLVGEVIGKYHPHGDSAAYETMVRLAQNFSMRYPLIDGHGNFGSIDGDSAAAMRYTEARLSKLADEMMFDIEKNTVDFVDNYDGSEREPVVLPSVLPNMLANGSSGIAVGMATNIPPHNLRELSEAIKLVSENPETTIDEIRQVLQGPDFPTAAEIIGAGGIDSYFNTGKGSITIRAKSEYVCHDNGKSTIHITEIPYMVNKVSLIERIVELVKNDAIEGIADLRDESNREGIRIVIETKKDVVPEVLLNQLYKSTQLQSNFSVNMLALVNGEPKLLNIKEALEIYIKHQIEVITRKTEFELGKAKDREHILEGLHIATANIDEIISIIRKANDNTDAASILMSKFNLSELQSKAILEMRLKSLSSMERNKIETELSELKALILDLTDILAKRERKIKIMDESLAVLVKKFGDERRTRIETRMSANIDDEDLIPMEDIVVTLSSRGYLKRMPVDTYRVQRRGGVGVIGMQTHNDDDVDKIIVASTHTDLLFFTNLGKIYRMRGHKVPLGSRQSKGIPAINLINIEKSEKILTIVPVDNYNEDESLFFATLKGVVKKTKLNEFERINCNGKIAITLKEGDLLFNVVKIKENQTPSQEIYLGASNGNMVRFDETEVRCLSRTASGVHGIDFEEREQLVGLSTSVEGNMILSVGAKGIGKLTNVEEYRKTKRNAKGVRTLKVSPKTGKLVYVGAAKGDEDVLMITSSGKIIRFPLSQVSQLSRSTQGVKLMDVDGDEKIQSVTLFEHNEGESTDTNTEITAIEETTPITE